jgi:octaprenyl-diphosphate synthase
MINIIRDRDFSVADFNTLIGLLEKYGGLAYTRNTAASYIDTAKKALTVFSPSPTRETMLDIAEYALARSV